MRNQYISFVYVVLLLCGVACQDAGKEMYSDETVGLYFRLENLVDDTTLIVNQNAQSVTYTFVYDNADVNKREVCVPVQLFGDAVNRNRTYRIEVTPSVNTVEGIDYEPIVEMQTFSAGKTVDSLRIVWKRNLGMTVDTKRLDIRIVPEGDFGMPMQEKSSISLLASEIYEEPDWWSAWSVAFGSYHRIKLREWNALWGRSPLPTEVRPSEIGFLLYPQECLFITKLKELFERKTFTDELGNRLTIPGINQ